MAERRARIVRAAYDLLARDGLEGLTIRSVLAETGLARRAFYDRFATKDVLVLAVFQHTLSDAAARFAEHDERLRLIVVGIVLGHGRRDADGDDAPNYRAAALSREHLRLAEARPAELQRAIAPLVELIATQLQAGMQSGQVRSANGERLAHLVYNLVSTTVHSQLIAEEHQMPDLEDRSRLAGDLWEFCLRAVSA